MLTSSVDTDRTAKNIIESMVRSGLPALVANALEESGEEILEKISNAVASAAAYQVIESEAECDRSALWSVVMPRGSVVPEERSLTQPEATRLVIESVFDLVIHEPASTITLTASTESPRDFALDQLGSNEAGMLWLLMSCLTTGYIRDEDFQNVRSQRERLNESTAYRNYVSAFKKWLGHDMASKWIGRHTKSGLPIIVGQVGYIWIRQHRDIKRSRLLANSYLLKGL